MDTDVGTLHQEMESDGKRETERSLKREYQKMKSRLALAFTCTGRIWTGAADCCSSMWTRPLSCTFLGMQTVLKTRSLLAVNGHIILQVDCHEAKD